MLTEVGVQRRLNQLIPVHRAALWFPLDDGLISGPEAHLRDPRTLLAPEVVDSLTAVLGFRGMIAACRTQLANAPVILNLSASTIRHEHTRKAAVGGVIDAVKIGAQAVACQVNVRSPFEAEALVQLSNVIADAESYGMPVIAMIYPRGRQDDGSDDNFLALRANDEEAFTAYVRHAVRVAVELGASAVKTIYTGSEASFRTVVASAIDVPVVVAGERLVDAEDAIAKAQSAIKAGAVGVAYGRQIFGRDDPSAFVQKLRSAMDDERFAMKTALAARNVVLP